mgnify:CR=1 FL=1
MMKRDGIMSKTITLMLQMSIIKNQRFATTQDFSFTFMEKIKPISISSNFECLSMFFARQMDLPKWHYSPQWFFVYHTIQRLLFVWFHL